jgi:hypothetical protein
MFLKKMGDSNMINASKLKENVMNSERLKIQLCHNVLQYFQLEVNISNQLSEKDALHHTHTLTSLEYQVNTAKLWPEQL